MWFCMKGFQLQQEISAAGLDNHPIINNVLNEMLKTEIVTRSVMEGELKKLRGEMQAIRKDVEAAQKVAQQTLSKTKK